MTRIRPYLTYARALLLCTLIATLVCVPAASAADFTWAGGSGSWSAGASWAGGVPPSGTVGTLSFPAAACSTTACPSTFEDVGGLTAATMLVRGPAPWGFGGTAPLTLTAGLDVQGGASLSLPIVLGADNIWSVDGGQVDASGSPDGFGISGDHGLTLNLTHGATLIVHGRPIEAGPVTVSGGGTLSLMQESGTGPGQPGPNASLNGANGHPVAINGASLYGRGSPTVGALTSSAGTVGVSSGTMATASASFDAASTLSLQTELDGTDYSGLSSTGAINLGGAKLNLFTDPGFCSQKPGGTVFTLVSTTATLSGEFANLPEGAVLGSDGGPACASGSDANRPERLRIAYHRDGATKTVTATLERPFVLVSGTTGNWSAASSWVGKEAPVAGQHIGRLSLGSGCGAPGCVNDLDGLTIDELVGPTSGAPGPLRGKAITLGAGGLSGFGNFALPITLSAAQKWTLNSTSGPANLVSTGGLSGAALTIAHTHGAFITLGGVNELAKFATEINPTTAAGFTLTLGPGATLNAASGNPVALAATDLIANGGAVGALQTTFARVMLAKPATVQFGSPTRPSSLKAASVAFGPSSGPWFYVAAGAKGTAPGVDYSQLDVSGAVDLGGNRLVVLQTKPPGGECGSGAPLGTVYTIVSAKGPLTGTFHTIKDGDVVQSTCAGGPSTKFGLEIHYTAHTVTATVRSLETGTGVTAFEGTAGDNVMKGDGSANVICGLGGDDTISGLGGDDQLFGDACSAGTSALARAAARDGNDKLLGGAGKDRLDGAGGKDTLDGGAGNDRLFGGLGNDILRGTGGKDTLDGGKGGDKLVGGPGVNKYTGGAGNDTIDAKNRTAETVNCGAGKKDVATVDKKDKVKGCERVKRA